MASPQASTGADSTFPAFYRHRRVAGANLLTNLAGQWIFLEDAELDAFRAGTLEKDGALYGELARKNFIRAEADVDDLAARMRSRKEFLRYGPNLHIMVVTLRCNETCAYCHSSRADMSDTSKDMSRQTAEQVVDLALASTSPSVTLEFQGGEPLVAFDVIRHTVEYALEKNRSLGKTLEFTLVSNLSLMDDEKAEFIVQNKIQVCTSVDGPADLHNKQRVLPGGDAHQRAVEWIRRLNEAYADIGLDPEVYHVEALPTVTRETLGRAEELIDTFVELGCKAIFLRPLDPFGFAARTRRKLGYSPTEFLDFYRRAVDYAIELNRGGTKILERFAGIFLTKIVGETDPNFLDIRSPCGAGIGQVAYNYDGRMFTCDEGRMLSETGDDLFELGRLGETGYADLMRHDMVKSIAIASNLDASPDCGGCAYNPYCGVCPVYNYATQGSLYGKMRVSSWCAVHMGIQDYLFGKLRDADAELERLFQRWISVRPRDHYLHSATASV